ncbi:MAG TPA: DUF2254 domain-containing protein [Pyrinomonadaceae bacterium]|nr:DUF2254 domain-containing protein [Pyrinomonadaceae bacterium]
MSWLTRHRIRLYVRNSIWLLPAASIVAGLASVALLTRVDRAFGWEMRVGLDTARAIVGTVAGSMFSLLVLVCSAVLVAVQLASAQLTPRIITLVYRNPFRKFALALFAFTFTFAVGLLVRLEESVPLVTGYLAAYGFLLNLALFLLFVDGVGKTLRPSTALRTVALLGREVVASVYPRRLDERRPAPPAPFKPLEGGPRRVVLSEEDGAVLAFDLKGLVSLAGRADCLVELVPEVGDYVAAGDPLFHVYEGGGRLSEDDLRGSVALGPERTLEQDPLFAFRIIVDIAARALSPAVNDPTTAVTALDHIQHLLRHVGRRDLSEGRAADAAGRVRLVYRTPGWDDFVRIAVTEIRQYGRDSIQVMRRLRAMLENLIETLPERRGPALRRELELLEDSAKRTFPDADDQNLAKTGDLQGLGGSSNGRRAPEVSSVANSAA